MAKVLVLYYSGWGHDTSITSFHFTLGSRQSSENERIMARAQGAYVARVAAKMAAA
jgi:hypothetical protein